MKTTDQKTKANSKYNATQKGKEAHCRAAKKYDATQKRKDSRRRYESTQKCKEARRRAIKKYESTQKGKEAQRKYASTQKGKEAHRRAIKKYSINHGDKLLAMSREWKRTHPEASRILSANRRVRSKNAEGHYSSKYVVCMMKSQKGKCYYCGEDISKLYHVEHVVPLSRGGANNPSNLVLSCPRCNLSKGTKLPHEWAEGNRLL